MTITGTINRLKAECENVNAIQMALRNIMESKPDNWKMDYIGKRKQLSLSYGNLANIANDLLPLVDDRTVATGFQKALTQMRHKTALHQASWPVVTIETSLEKYLLSLREIESASAVFRAATDALLEWGKKQKNA